ncbi:hypothetical protein [Amycolatopsis sp. NPDC051372]|uniref:hypothetical protein n=1 Tax=unclassified Amycolatopsis TaxID=2618356 RepID=UPI003431B27E
MNLAESWYESQLLWSVTAVVVAIVLGVPAIVVAVCALPRRRLTYTVLSDIPLLSRSVSGSLEVRHEGRVGDDPRVVTVVLVGSGRQDIPSSGFDQGRPLVLDFAVPIVELLTAQSASPSLVPAPQVRMDTTALLVGPSLISKRHVLTYSVLVDGQADLACQAPLENVLDAPRVWCRSRCLSPSPGRLEGLIVA